MTVKHVSHCLVATTASGQFKPANKTVPITKPIVVQGGIVEGSHVLVPGGRRNTLSALPDRPRAPPGSKAGPWGAK